ncbi:unnamed protein product [Discosporangium mesarthrocarpum]
MWSGGGALGHGSTKSVDLPQEIQALTEAEVKVSGVGAGENHTVFLAEDGEVWCCGSGEYGRCGNGVVADIVTPEPVEALEDFIITDIQVGHAFTLALSSDGELFVWGRNDAGQLGLGGGLSMDVYAMEDLPKPLEGLAEEKVVTCAAGHSHAAAVTEEGKLFMWGMKRYLEPEWMSALEGKRVVDVSCGDKFTAAITDTGELYTFGKGGSLSLGHGDKVTQLQPVMVKALRGLGVHRVYCGHSHMAALVEPPPSSTPTSS